VLGNKPITSYATSEAAQFRDWCFEQGMSLNTVKRVFAAVRSIINLIMREHGIEGTSDRLRTVQCPSEMIDQIGRRSLGNIGQKYGDGFNLPEVFAEMHKL
jgi:hypothetical protein